MVIKQLVYLLALDRARHFGAAADACHVTQPTLSAAIRHLEEDLGVPIVERGNRFIGFTPEGERVLSYARRIVADCDALKLELLGLRHGLSGHLRLGVVPSALPIVSLITAPFAVRHPNVRLTILSMTSIDIQQGLDQFTLEAGITYLDNEPLPHVKGIALYEENYLLLTPIQGPLALNERATWREAARLRLCLLTPSMQNRRIIDHVFQSVDMKPQALIETNSIINLCSHVQSGYWSSIIPHSLLQAFGIPVGTKALLLEEPFVSRGMGLVIADRTPPSPLGHALMDLTGKLDLETILKPNRLLKKTI